MITTTYYIDCSGADRGLLNRKSILDDLLAKISRIASLNIVAKAGHEFKPQGISLAYVLSESHIAIHTWPENGTAYIVLSTCKSLNTLTVNRLKQQIETGLKCSVEMKVIS